MPVVLDRGPLGYRLFAASEQARGQAILDLRNKDCIKLGLVNNMPDLALEQTERQILKLLDAAAGDINVVLKLYALPDLPREEIGQQHLSRMHYRTVNDLWAGGLDALIVTGAEPRTADLEAEPYWDSLTSVFDWAECNTVSTITSCLAVHAAVLHFDGIVRRSLPRKCFGVFEFENASTHRLLAGVSDRVQIPHSRWNEISEDALTAHGYEILIAAPDRKVDTFVKAGNSLFVFFQGHPEYEPWTLLGEYRRDIGRFLGGERKSYPDMPERYFDAESARALNAFRDRTLATAGNERGRKLMESFPTDILVGKLSDVWRASAVQIYRNWLHYLAEEKDRTRQQRRRGDTHSSSAASSAVMKRS